ncbi:thiosulfate sulfurtransferase GlpE [Oceanospirillum sediminis]|uniref:Thiosulfate sulfurtransferase GlpE n=1 Tax=Oceanospirillum sediminis TaxID=2760088 RepID=A0A839IJW9_9GAMM|nr:thiosulfate sulfurtransferase GlpE [Oceanospirillum sediminis]MBB1485228.1 thiosulfate sulfurtransferase GlpE [Oceanospirillum sediminis]
MSFQFINPDELNTRIENQDPVVIVDIRDPNSFAMGRITSAQALNNDNVQQFIENTDKSLPVIVCCYHGNSSQGAAQVLFEQGFTDVYSLNGGYEIWKNSYPALCES